MADTVGLRGYRVQDPAKTLARRQEIMLAMAEVIIDKGYSSATLEDVATKMGTSRAVIYYQFRSKEDLYAEVVVESVSQASARLEAIIAAGAPPEQTLYSAIRDLCEIGMEPLNRSTLLAGRPRDLTPESRARIRVADRGYERLLTQIIRSGIESGVFVDRDVRFLRYTLMFAVNGNFIWRRPDGPLKADYILDNVPEMLLNSMLKHPCDFHPHAGTPAAQTLNPS